MMEGGARGHTASVSGQSEASRARQQCQVDDHSGKTSVDLPDRVSALRSPVWSKGWSKGWVATVEGSAIT